ncbi:SRP72 RNA-binding domain-containing protein [Sodiomyces alkalinus F11]|uniref:Signal recognition particle subunit SRP72 n=1 Tax=Sodiomyces alkalinus (strain CBS 110278 / VKM F-3762 / F11) TaxID=1314773 RepID=A0A3N2PJW8_SODAK|nr:SRP72 RNA-binding domain-containing protein [Sodiomyces alkalinus F11]ROT34815.1 SRP72 RNA-binding domain-containing protein [Sodiomyces alkalinus F11]
MPATTDPSSTLASLLHAFNTDDYQVLEAANAALKSSSPDPKALAAKVVALLRLDRFDDALRALAEAGSDAEEACTLQRCYALYKSGDLDGASALAQLSLTRGRAYFHIAAQAAYRAEKFQDASALYTALVSSENGAAWEESDLAINSLAVTAQQNWQGADSRNDEHTSTPVAPHSFELAYNMACCNISCGEFLKALTLLKLASRLCSTSDDLSEDERRAEMVPILVQEMYTYSRLGKQAEAQSALDQLSSYGFEDDEIKLIIENNSSALQAHGGNAFSTLRQVERALGPSKSVRLFQHQEHRLERNRFALALRAQKYPGVVHRTKCLLETSTRVSSDVFVLSTVNAAARSLQGSGVMSLRDILAVAITRPSDIGAALTAIQLYAASNRPEAALHTLEVLFTELEERNALEMRFSPGLVALAVTLHRLQGRVKCMRADLAKASLYWNKQGNVPRGLLRTAGAELLKSPDAADLATAQADFQKVHSHTAEDPIATTGLIASFATNNQAKAEGLIGDLPPAADLAHNVDVQGLVNAGLVLAQTSPVAASGKRSTEVGGNHKTRQTRRLRNSHKSHEEGKVLDPERWLPLRDRSSSRLKGKKAKRKANENTQGGIVREEETLELAGGAGSVKVEKAQASSGSFNSKKKKGKK